MTFTKQEWNYQEEYEKFLTTLKLDNKPWICVEDHPAPQDGSIIYFMCGDNWYGTTKYDVGYYADYTKKWWYEHQLGGGCVDGEFNTEFGNCDDIIAWKYVEINKCHLF